MVNESAVVVFDDERAVANAGVMLPALLATRLGIEQLVDDSVDRLAAFGDVPYWSTNSADGKYCFVSFAADDQVSVISYGKEKEIARIQVGEDPQRMRMGKFPRV